MEKVEKIGLGYGGEKTLKKLEPTTAVVGEMVALVEIVEEMMRLAASSTVFAMYPFFPLTQYVVKQIMKMTVFFFLRFICLLVFFFSF